MRSTTFVRLCLVSLAGSLAAMVPAGAPSPSGAQKGETVNCVVAVVGSRMITLTDVRLVEAFDIFDIGPEPDPAKRRRLILDRLIDQKVILDLARESAPVEAVHVEKAWTELLGRMGREEAKRRLEAFGAEPVDLLPYFEEKLLAESVIDKRFSRSAPISLQEIETYYAEIFGPSRRSLGLPVPPLIEVVDAVENEIRRAKLAVQTAQWILNLRQQAEIEIRPDCLK
jgi:hypothetical protein